MVPGFLLYIQLHLLLPHIWDTRNTDVLGSQPFAALFPLQVNFSLHICQSLLPPGWCLSLVLDQTTVAIALLLLVFLFSSRPSQITKDPPISPHEDHS